MAWIPFGREQTVSILIKYLLMDAIIDEIWLCMNTDPVQISDRAFADQLAVEHEKIVQKVCPGPDTPDLSIPAPWRDGFRHPKQLNTGRFPIYMTDPNTVFLRFDDDIIWVHPDTPRTLVDRVLDRRDDTLGVFALIYNNAICSWLLQQRGRIPREWGVVGQGLRDTGLLPAAHQVSAVDPVGWESPLFAEKLHHEVLAQLEAGLDDTLRLGAEMSLGWRQQFSVSCFGISGEEYEVLGGVIDWDEEEHWLTMHRTGVVQKANIVCGMAPVAHYTFFTQGHHIVKTDILDRYRAVADRKWREHRLGHGYYDELEKTA